MNHRINYHTHTYSNFILPTNRIAKKYHIKVDNYLIIIYHNLSIFYNFIDLQCKICIEFFFMMEKMCIKIKLMNNNVKYITTIKIKYEPKEP